MFYSVKNIIVYDLEVYQNWFLAGFQTPDGLYYQYEFPSGGEINDRFLDALREFLDWAKRDHVIAGWNSRSYDDPVLTHFLNNPSPEEAYQMSYNIIQNGARSWDFPNQIWSIDLKRIVPGNLGLKRIGVCLGHKRLQELPVAWDRPLTPQQMELVKDYNRNDLDITRKVQKVLQPELDLRAAMSEKYRIDLRSKGEAQIAESVLIEESNVQYRELKAAASANANAEIFIREPYWWKTITQYANPGVDQILDLGREIFQTPIPILESSLRISAKPLVRTIYLADKFYRMGVGGLHSVDGPGSTVPDDNHLLVDIDVASYYPNLILTQKLAPRHWGPKFLEVYQSVVTRRLEAKRAGDKTTAAVLKIVTNGTFGKTSDPYSSLYDPWVTANVTVLGQLALLLLIAQLSHSPGHRVISANTDGITVLVHKNQEHLMQTVVDRWEQLTGLVMEYTYYRGLYQLDVNNYMAVTTGGDLKLKGRIVDTTDLRHTPNFPIVAKAVQEAIWHGTPVASTILCCTDINQFILTQQVTGDWTTSWKGQPLGKMLRWYKSKYSLDPLMRHPGKKAKGNEGVVANGENAVPLENLPDTFPKDVMYEWYIKQATDWLLRLKNPKSVGKNAEAKILHDMGLRPLIISKESPTKSKPAFGSQDFNSLLDNEPNNELIAVSTGKNVIALVENGETTLYRTSKSYPARTRPLIKRDFGFELIYGRSVDVWSMTLQEERDWDEYYTPAELQRVRQ